MKLLSSHLYWGIRFSTRFDKWFAPSLTVQSLFYTSFNQKKVFFSFCRNMNLMLFIPLLKGNLLNSKFLSLALSIDTFQKAIHISFTRTVRINETLVKHTIAVKTKCSHLLSRTFVIPKRRSFCPPPSFPVDQSVACDQSENLVQSLT